MRTEMLERWTRMREAGKALADGRLDEAVRLSLDPEIREHRKAVAIRAKATRRLLRRAKEHRDRNNLSAAIEDVRLAMEHGERSSEAIGLERDLRSAMQDRDLVADRWRERLESARRRVETGDLEGAREVLAAPHGEARPAEAADLDARLAHRLEEAGREVEVARRAMAGGDARRAHDAMERARVAFPASPEVAALDEELRRADRDRRVVITRDQMVRGELHEAAEGYAALLDEAPGAASARDLAKLGDDMGRALGKKARALFESGDPRGALRLLAMRTWLDITTGDSDDGLAIASSLFERALAARGEGRVHLEVALLRAAADCVRSKDLAKRVKLAQEAADVSDRALRRASDLSVAGDRDRAKAAIAEALGSAPNDSLLHAFDEGMADVDPERIATPARWKRWLDEGQLASAVRAVATALPIAGLSKEAPDLLARAIDARREAAATLARAERTFAEAGGDPERLEEALALDERAKVSDADVRLAPSLRDRAEEARECRLAGERLDALIAGGDLAGALGQAVTLVRSGAEPRTPPALAAEVQRRVRRLVRDVLARAEAALDAGSPSIASRCMDDLERLDLTPVARGRVASLAARLDRAAAGADQIVAEVRARIEAFDGPAARAALARLRSLFPGHVDEAALSRECDAIEAAGPEVARVRRFLAEGRRSAALAALEGVPGDVATSPVVRELREEIERASSFSERFFVRVEEGRDYLVLAKDEIRIGNITGRNLDLSILASLSSEHAVVRRTRSFHGGTKYEIEALDGRECRVNGERTVRRELADGDRIRLGEDLEILFRVPCRGSTAAALDLADGYDVDGARTVLLMSSGGKDGRLIVGREAAHILVPEAERPVEIWRQTDSEGAGELLCHCLTGVLVDGEGGTAQASLRHRCYVECGPCRLSFETFVPRNLE